MKAQASIIENLIVIFFVIVILVILMIVLTNYQFYEMEMEKRKIQRESALTFAKRFLNIQLVTKTNGILEDAKLSALYTIPCEDLEKILGTNWFVEVKIFEDNDITIPCTVHNYPECNYWVFTSCNRGMRNVSYTLPVNIYRKMLERTDIGIIKAGLYVSD